MHSHSPGWAKVTLCEEPKDPMTIDYKFTPAERDHALICELEVAAMKRHRNPPGLDAHEISWAEYAAARDAFRRLA